MLYLGTFYMRHPRPQHQSGRCAGTSLPKPVPATSLETGNGAVYSLEYPKIAIPTQHHPNEEILARLVTSIGQWMIPTLPHPISFPISPAALSLGAVTELTRSNPIAMGRPRVVQITLLSTGGRIRAPAVTIWPKNSLSKPDKLLLPTM